MDSRAFGDGELDSVEGRLEIIQSFIHSFIHYIYPLLVKLDLPLTNIRINVKSPLRINRYPLPRLLNLFPIQIRIHNLLRFPCLTHDARIRIHNHTMPPSIISRLHIPRRTAQAHIDLIVHRPGPRLQLPVQGPRRQVESAGVQEQEAALAGGNGGEFGEADVVADREGDLAVGREVDEGQFVPGGEDVRLPEGDLAGDVDVEQMHLAMRGQQVSLGREEQASVVVLLRRGHVFGYAAAEQVAPALDGKLGQGAEARRLLPRRRGRLQRLGVRGEVLAAVGRVEAFRQHDERGSGFGGFEHAGARAGEVGGFVGAW